MYNIFIVLIQSLLELEYFESFEKVFLNTYFDYLELWLL